MSDAEEPPPERAEPLDFSGACLILPESGADDTALQPEDLLVAHSFGDAAVLLPSAGTAWRVLLETIRTRQRIAGRPKRRRILACMGDWPIPPALAADAGVEIVPDDIGAVRAAIGPEVAGILISPVRRAAGLQMLSGAILADLREAADEYGLALVFDETDAGLGRTGMAFAHEWTGVTPDLMVVGEGAGLPLATLVVTEKYARALPATRPEVPPDDRASTTDLLAAVFAPGFEARIQERGWLLEDRLAALRYRRPDLFRDLAGTGLMQGLACTGPADELAQRLAEAGVLAAVHGEVLAFLPPLSVAEADILAAMDRLEQLVAEMEPAEAGL